jgi:hypothetical protein
MIWTKEPGAPGLYLVVFKGERTAANYNPGPHPDGSIPIFPVDLIGSDSSFMVGEITAWCRIPDPPPLPPELQ